MRSQLLPNFTKKCRPHQTQQATNKVAAEAGEAAEAKVISAAQLLRSGAQIHLERNNSYILLTNNKRINLIEKGGLLYIPALDYDADDEEDEEKQRLKAADQAAAFLGFVPSANELTNNNEDKNELTTNNQPIPDSDGGVFPGQRSIKPRVCDKLSQK